MPKDETLLLKTATGSQPTCGPKLAPAMNEAQVDEIVDLISVTYADERPTFTEDENSVKAWALLNEVEKDPNILRARHLLKLHEVKWFSKFFTPIMMNNLFPDKTPKMTYKEMILLLKEACPKDPPEEGQSNFTKRSNGQPIMFVPEKALAAITRSWLQKDGLSAHERTMFETLLPWGRSWILNSIHSAKAAKRSAALKVSTANKVTLLKIFHSHFPPSYKDFYPVGVEGGDVYIFRPSEWLGDIANNWLEGNRHRVKLSDAEMKDLEDIPWFKNWIHKLGELREKKRCRADSMLKPYTPQVKKAKSV